MKTTEELTLQAFERSAQLVKQLASAPVGSSTLLDVLRFGEISLWEVAEPYLALYKFPPHILQNMSLKARLGQMIRSYWGTCEHPWSSLNVSPSATWQSTADRSQTVLFLNFTPRHYPKAFKSVVPHLNAAGIIPVVLSLQPISPDHKTGQIISQSPINYYTSEVATEFEQLQAEYQKIQQMLFRPNVLAQVVRSQDESLWPALKWTFLHLLRNEFPPILQQLALAEQILKIHRPSLIIVGEDADMRTRLYTLLARRYGIPSLLIQVGRALDLSVDWRLSLVDKMAVFGPRTARVLEAHGVEPERIVLTGAPEFDRLLVSNQQKAATVKEAFGISADRALVVFASQPFLYGAFTSDSKRRLMIKAIYEAAESLAGLKLLVKPHPQEDMTYLQELAKNSVNVVVVDKSYDINDLIVACDIFITFFSTTTLQALVADKPVINVAFAGSGVLEKLPHRQATFVVSSMEEIIEQLKLLLGNQREAIMAKLEPTRQALLYDLTYLLDQRASKRVAELALDMLAEA